MAETRLPVCQLCGKASTKTICDACADRLRGEALGKKKKEEKRCGLSSRFLGILDHTAT